MSVFTNPMSASPEQAKAYTTATLELLGARDPIEVLEETSAALREGIDGLSPALLAQPEAPGKWSVRQVLKHLADCELVWGYRLRMVLAHHRPPLIGFDQDLWAERLGYQEAEVEDSLAEFGVLRDMNLRLLERASPEDLKRVGVHAERGEGSVEHMIQMEAGHDLLHLRQLDRIRKVLTGQR